MNKLLLAFLWIFTLAVAYWYGLTQKMESDRLSANRSEVTNLQKDTLKVESKEQGSLPKNEKTSVPINTLVEEKEVTTEQEVGIESKDSISDRLSS